MRAMPRAWMSTARTALALAAALGATGCQTFIGLEDAEGHLPRLDGSYLIAIERLRANGMTRDILRLRGTARLDVDARSLDLSLSLLRFDDGTPFTETAITDITFDDDRLDTEFMLNMAVPDAAVAPGQDAADQTLTAAVVFIAEDDYSFCARPLTGELPTVGSVLLATPGGTATPDANCDL